MSDLAAECAALKAQNQSLINQWKGANYRLNSARIAWDRMKRASSSPNEDEFVAPLSYATDLDKALR